MRTLRIALFLVLFLAPAPVLAFNLGEWVPGLTVTPFVSERAEYETNVFQTPSHAKGDLISRTIPGVLGEYAAGPLSLTAGYRAEILRFLDMASQDSVHQFAVGQGRLESSRLLVNVRDDYTVTSDPPNSELTGRITSKTNVATPEIEYRLTDRFSVGGNYSFTRVTFPTIAALDRDEHLGGGSVFWKFQPKTDLRLSYLYGVKSFGAATERDVTRNVIQAGLRGDLTSKLSSTFRLGYESREPRQAHLASYHGPVGGGDWIFRLTERTTFSLLTDRSVQESTFENALFFVSTSVTLVAEHRFVPKLAASVRLTGGTNHYPTKETVGGLTKWRDDMLIGFGGGIAYDIQRWFRVGVEYQHTQRESNFKEFSFADDKVTAAITFQF